MVEGLQLLGTALPDSNISFLKRDDGESNTADVLAWSLESSAFCTFAWCIFDLSNWQNNELYRVWHSFLHGGKDMARKVEIVLSAEAQGSYMVMP